MRARLAVLTCGLLLTAAGSGCSGQESIDREQWKAELASAGAPAPDLDRLEPLVRDSCGLDDHALQYSVAAARDDGERGVELMKVNFHNVCPDEEDRLYKAIAYVDDSTREVQAACDEPAGDRSQDEQDLAELMGCE